MHFTHNSFFTNCHPRENLPTGRQAGIQVANCLDSRLPLGHELEAEWRGNDNKVDYAENTYVCPERS